MTIKMNKRYAQTSHYVPTQATPWAIESLNRDANVEHTDGMLSASSVRQQSAVTNQLHAPGGASGMEHAAGRLKTAGYISAINDSTGRDAFGFDTHPLPEVTNHGGGIVARSPERDAELHLKNPGLMDRWLQQGSRSDGGH